MSSTSDKMGQGKGSLLQKNGRNNESFRKNHNQSMDKPELGSSIMQHEHLRSSYDIISELPVDP